MRGVLDVVSFDAIEQRVGRGILDASTPFDVAEENRAKAAASEH